MEKKSLKLWQIEKSFVGNTDNRIQISYWFWNAMDHFWKSQFIPFCCPQFPPSCCSEKKKELLNSNDDYNLILRKSLITYSEEMDFVDVAVDQLHDVINKKSNPDPEVGHLGTFFVPISGKLIGFHGFS